MLKIMSDHDPEKLDGPWTDYEGAAERTTLSETYLRQLVMAGRIPFRKVGKRVLFSIPALDEWVSRNGTMETTADEPAA
jgi:excisionase family DNA binding protein